MRGAGAFGFRRSVVGNPTGKYISQEDICSRSSEMAVIDGVEGGRGGERMSHSFTHSLCHSVIQQVFPSTCRAAGPALCAGGADHNRPQEAQTPARTGRQVTQGQMAE